MLRPDRISDRYHHGEPVQTHLSLRRAHGRLPALQKGTTLHVYLIPYFNANMTIRWCYQEHRIHTKKDLKAMHECVQR